MWNGCDSCPRHTPDTPLLLALRTRPDPEWVWCVGPQVAYGTGSVWAGVGSVECDVFVFIRLNSAIAILYTELPCFYLLIHLKSNVQETVPECSLVQYPSYNTYNQTSKEKIVKSLFWLHSIFFICTFLIFFLIYYYYHYYWKPEDAGHPF